MEKAMAINIAMLKKLMTVALPATGLMVIGFYLGAYFVERDDIKKTLNDSMLQIAQNLETAKYIREGRTTNAIELLNANSEVNLLYLMHYDDVAAEDTDFILRKKKVLAALNKEWKEHARINAGKDNPFQSDPQWQSYKNDLKKYLEKWQNGPGSN